MNYKQFAIDDLKNYEALRISLMNLPDKISEIQSRKTEIRSARTDGVPVKGGGNAYEERILDCMVAEARLDVTLQRNKWRMNDLERSLSHLTDEERRVLDLFYMHHRSKCVDILCQELHYEKSQIYRIRDQALIRFTKMMYGCIED